MPFLAGAILAPGVSRSLGGPQQSPFAAGAQGAAAGRLSFQRSASLGVLPPSPDPSPGTPWHPHPVGERAGSDAPHHSDAPPAFAAAFTR